MDSFSIGESLSFGWQKTKEHFLFFLLAFGIYLALVLGLGIAQKMLGTSGPGLAVWVLGNLVVNPLLGLGFRKAVLTAVDGGKPEWNELFSQGHLLLTCWLVILLWLGILFLCFLPFAAAAVMALGLSIFQVGPGTLHHPLMFLLLPLFMLLVFLVLAVRFGFVQWALVDKGLGPVGCFKRSAAISRGHGVKLFLFGLTVFFLNLLGLICLVVGLFVTVLVSYCAFCSIYRKLDSQTSLS
jgi:hypothetical protein